MNDVVLDASAVIADLRGEPGGDMVHAVDGTAYLSAVNYAEVITKLIDAGASDRMLYGVRT